MRGIEALTLIGIGRFLMAIPALADEGSRVKQVIENTSDALSDANAPAIDLQYGPLGVAREQAASGTSRLPRSAPSYSLLFDVERWGVLVRGNIFVGYGYIGRDAPVHDVVSVNQLSVAAFGDVGGGELMPRAALSWEAFLKSEGSLSLLQAVPFTTLDRQEPHELATELSLTYTRVVAPGLALFAYGAVAGDPALGPPTYLTRPSAYFAPMAPASRFILESSRSSFGVLTAGVETRRSKVEFSWFNTTNDPTRHYDLNFERPRSLAVRASHGPSPNWMLQTSYGWLRPRGRDAAPQDVHRWTASAVYTKETREDRRWAMTLASGIDHRLFEPAEMALLAESAWHDSDHHTVFGRAELLRRARSAYENTSTTQSVLPVGTLMLGYLFTFRPFAALAPGVGAAAQLALVPEALDGLYRTPVTPGCFVYAQLRQASWIESLEGE